MNRFTAYITYRNNKGYETILMRDSIHVAGIGRVYLAGAANDQAHSQLCAALVFCNLLTEKPAVTYGETSTGVK